MQELIEKIVDEAARLAHLDSDYKGYPFADLRKFVTSLLPPATILPSQFVNGEPEEDGEYVALFEDSNKDRLYMVIDYNVGDRFRFTILSHAKLPE